MPGPFSGLRTERVSIRDGASPDTDDIAGRPCNREKRVRKGENSNNYLYYFIRSMAISEH